MCLQLCQVHSELSFQPSPPSSARELTACPFSQLHTQRQDGHQSVPFLFLWKVSKHFLAYHCVSGWKSDPLLRWFYFCKGERPWGVGVKESRTYHLLSTSPDWTWEAENCCPGPVWRQTSANGPHNSPTENFAPHSVINFNDLRIAASPSDPFSPLCCWEEAWPIFPPISYTTIPLTNSYVSGLFHRWCLCLKVTSSEKSLLTTFNPSSSSHLSVTDSYAYDCWLCICLLTWS